MTGEALVAFVSAKGHNQDPIDLNQALVQQVRKAIGPFATPRTIFFVLDLPKTRSGKIMRRILRKILEGEGREFGDTSTVRELFLGFGHETRRVGLYSQAFKDADTFAASGPRGNSEHHKGGQSDGESQKIACRESLLTMLVIMEVSSLTKTWAVSEIIISTSPNKCNCSSHTTTLDGILNIDLYYTTDYN